MYHRIGYNQYEISKKKQGKQRRTTANRDESRITKIAIPEYFRIYNEYVKDNKKKKALQKEYTEIAKTNGKASDCIMCRGCDGVCEQHLPTTYLRWVASVFK